MSAKIETQLGVITIDNEVIARIAGVTAMECYGIVGMAAKKQGTGYWLLGRDGGVFSFGSAQFFGTLSKCVVGNASMIQASPTGNGYIISATDGRIATFGDSRHFGWPYVTNVAPVGFNLMN